MEDHLSINSCKEGDEHCQIQCKPHDNTSSHPKQNDQILPSKKNTSSATKIVSSITTIHTKQDLDSILSSNEYVIVEFMTSWCTACQSIHDYYDNLSFQNQEWILSTNIPCDKNKQTKKLMSMFHITSYPVFLVFQNTNIIHRWNGADKGKLEGLYERLGNKKKKKGRSKRR